VVTCGRRCQGCALVTVVDRAEERPNRSGMSATARSCGWATTARASRWPWSTSRWRGTPTRHSRAGSPSGRAGGRPGLRRRRDGATGHARRAIGDAVCSDAARDREDDAGAAMGGAARSTPGSSPPSTPRASPHRTSARSQCPRTDLGSSRPIHWTRAGIRPGPAKQHQQPAWRPCWHAGPHGLVRTPLAAHGRPWSVDLQRCVPHAATRPGVRSAG
jgi:hypothetical protein